MIKMAHYFAIGAFCLLWIVRYATAEDYKIGKTSIPIGNHFNLKSKGAFRLDARSAGLSRAAYSSGPIAISNDERILYIAGHSQHFSVGSFAVNSKSSFGTIDSLPVANNFSPFINISPVNKPQQSANRIVGIEVVNGQLLVMSDEYYDADTNNSEFLVVFDQYLDLSSAKQVGFFPISPKSHAAGWMSKIPDPLTKDLEALYIAGSASNIPINGRHSIGPSLFTWFPYFLEHLDPKGNSISMSPLIDYSLNNPLHPDLSNKQGKNDLWTELSYAAYGFISPDQRSYIVIGHSGGHDSGVGYKITQKNGHQCGGYCAMDYKDYYNYFWIYSVSDIKKSFAGSIEPHEVKPVEYGKLPLLDYRYLIIGADFNRLTNHLYLSIDKLDTTQSKYESQPLIWVFELITKE